MPIDASIYSQIRPTVAPEGPLDQYAKMVSVKSLMGNEQLNEMQRTKLARDMQEEENFKALFAGATPDQMNAPDFLQRALGASPTRGIALQKSLLDQQKGQADLQKTRQEIEAKAMAEHRDQLANVKTPQDAAAWVQAGFSNPVLAPIATKYGGSPEKVLSTIPQDPVELQGWVQRNALGATKFIEQNKPNVRVQDLGATSQVISTPGLGGAPSVLSSTTKTATPGEMMTDKRQRDFYASPDSGDPKIEQQLDFWATVVRNGGSLPPGLARGPGGSAFVREVTKRAAVGNVTPEEMMSNQAQFQGEKAGQRTLGSRTANIEMAANEAASLADLAKQASAKVDRTQYKFFNDAMQAGQKATSSPDLRAFTASNTSLINAYARAINPQGVGTVADKEHARDMLSTAFSKGDYAATVDQLLQEIDAARRSPGQVRKAMREQFTGKPGEGSGAPAASQETRSGKPGGIKFLGFEEK